MLRAHGDHRRLRWWSCTCHSRISILCSIATGPTLLPNGLLMYEVTFPEAQDYGVVLATLTKDGTVTAWFFGNEKEYEAARGVSGIDCSQTSPGLDHAATARIVAPNRGASLAAGDRGRHASLAASAGRSPR